MRSGVVSLVLALAGLALADDAGGPQFTRLITGYDGLLQNESVQKELKLTEDQIQKSKEVIRDVRQKHRKDIEKLRQELAEQAKIHEVSQKERRQKMHEVMETVSKQTLEGMKDSLKPQQLRRLKQIELQQRGLAALSSPEADKILHLTDTQKSQIKKISESAAKEASEIVQSDSRESSFQEKLKKLAAAQQRAMDKGLAVLSGTQKTAWKELTGAPFEVKSGPSLIREPSK
jgi:hypothetical protein